MAEKTTKKIPDIRGNTAQPMKGMWRDSIESEQPAGTWSYMLNGQTQSFESSNVIVNESSNVLVHDLGDEWIILGGGFIEDRDQFLFFAYEEKENRSIIGTLSTVTGKTVTLIDDNKWDDKLCFSKFEYIPVTFKILQPCSHMMAYFSAGDWYYRLDLDASHCNLQLEDLRLLKCVCPPSVEATVIPDGGEALQSGAYQFVVQLTDKDLNVTNWFDISNPVYITTDNNKAGEISGQSIQIELDGIDNTEWSNINLGVVRTIGGQKLFNLLTTQPYPTTGMSFLYVGGEEGEDLSFEEIFSRQDRYIRGKNLIQKDGHLILFELVSEWNLNYQTKANSIGIEYEVRRVRADDACNHPTLMRDEVYSMGVKWNYCDGTSSVPFHIPGRAPTDYDREIIVASDDKNCTDCDLQRWQIENTASQIEQFCEEPYETSELTFRDTVIDQSEKVIYTPISKSEAEKCCEGKILECGESDGCGDGSCGDGNCDGKGSGDDDDTGNASCTLKIRYYTNIQYCDDCKELDDEGFSEFLEHKFSSTPPGLGDYTVDYKEITTPWPPNEDVPSVEITCGGYTATLVGKDQLTQANVHAVIDNNCVCSSTPLPAGIFPDGSCLGETCAEGTGCGSPSGCSGGVGGDGSCPEKVCYGCSDIVKGFFCIVDGEEQFRYDPEGELHKKTYQAANYNQVQKGATPAALGGSGDCELTPIYDETGCYIIGYEKPIVSYGNMAYWESLETYPMTIDCNGNFLYGDFAGKKIRHPKMPCILTEPHFISNQTGVPNPIDSGNLIDNETFVHILGLRLSGITPPDNLPKPLCEHKPFDIVYQKRDEKNKSIIGKGLFTGTFKGKVDEREYLVPKNGVNSLEYFDGNLSSDTPIKQHRGGWQSDVAAYNFHSPDTEFNKPYLSAAKAKIAWELYGQGYKYGQYAKGIEDINEMFKGRENQSGTRQWINLNHYKCASGNRFDRCCTDLVVGGEQFSREFGDNDHILNPSINVAYKFGFDVTGTYELKVYKEGSILIFEDNGSFNKDREYSKAILYKDLRGVVFQKGEHIRSEFTFKVNGYGAGLDSCTFEGEISLDTILCSKQRDNKCDDKGGKGHAEISITLHSPECNKDVDDEICKSELRCIKGISYANSHDIVKKGDEFTYPLLNLNRESSVYLEFEDNTKLALDLDTSAIDDFLTDGKYNGNNEVGGDLRMDQTSDGSFLGDAYIHEQPIHRAGGWYGSLKKENRKQYGRLESAPYITLYQGTDDDLLCGNASISSVGDTWISQYSFMRHSLVSDKIGTERDQRGSDSFSSNLFCSYKCKDVPKSGDWPDPRNRNGLRHFIDETGTTYDLWDGIKKFRGYFGSSKAIGGSSGGFDVYIPNVLNTQISMWVESSVNTCRRQKGSEENCELAYPVLGDFELDSNFPSEGDWRKSFFNCFHVERNEAPGWKIATRVIVNALTFSTIPCNALDWILGIDGCKPRCLGGTLLNPENCLIGKGKIKGNPSNYTQYNWDYSVQNDCEIFYGQNINYDTCQCDTRKSGSRYSDPQNIESHIDAYRNFKVNSFSDLGAEFGVIKDFFNVGNAFYAHTSDMVLKLLNDVETLQMHSGRDVLLGRAGFLQRAVPLQGGLEEGYAGTLDPNSSKTTPYGHLWVDREGREVYLYSGQGMMPLSMYGMSNEFKENLGIKLLNYFPDYNVLDTGGVGYKLGYDPRFKRILITKEDYEPKPGVKMSYLGKDLFDVDGKNTIVVGDPNYFCNRSFTVSFEPELTRWVSYHSYIPRGYFNDRNHMFSYNGSSFWKHGDTRGDYQTFYGEYHPHILDMVTYDRTKALVDYRETTLETEGKSWVNCHNVNNLPFTFNQAMFYNSNQSSGLLNLVIKDNDDLMSDIKENWGEVGIEQIDKKWKINGFIDRTLDVGVPLFECECERPSILKVSNEGNIKDTSDEIEHQTLEDDYLGMRFILDDPENKEKELVTKYVNNIVKK